MRVFADHAIDCRLFSVAFSVLKEGNPKKRRDLMTAGDGETISERQIQAKDRVRLSLVKEGSQGVKPIALLPALPMVSWPLGYQLD